MHRIVYLALILLFATPVLAQSPLAPTPPMGWNSWDSFGTTVTEAEVKANADYMAAKLKNRGWQYIVVDIQWSEKNPKMHGYRPDAELAMDANGRLIPAPNRFPSSSNGNGFKPLADYVHARGLKFGIHIMRGIPRKAVDANLPVAGGEAKAADVANKESICAWNTDMYGVDVNKGGQAYYDSIIELYSSWGVDFLKADDMFGEGPAGDHTGEIEALGKSIAKAGRPMVLSLSPGTRDDTKGEFLAGHAQMWRISNDLWDRWVDVKNQFARFAAWNRWVGTGHWPDGDMLPLGHIGIRAERGEPRMSLLTHEEQTALMTLWCITRSPLMFGGNLPDNDPFTLSLLTNADLIALNQKAVSSRQLFARGDQVVWVAEMPNSVAKYVAVFNIGDEKNEKVKITWAELGLPEDCIMHDVWDDQDVGTAQLGNTFDVEPHASAIFRIMPMK
jgi:alpha-galactosidase